jgi:hypothetical protein
MERLSGSYQKEVFVVFSNAIGPCSAVHPTLHRWFIPAIRPGLAGDSTHITFGEVFSIFFMQSTPLLQKFEAFSLRVSKGEAVVGYCDPLMARRLGASGFPAG